MKSSNGIVIGIILLILYWLFKKKASATSDSGFVFAETPTPNTPKDFKGGGGEFSGGGSSGSWLTYTKPNITLKTDYTNAEILTTQESTTLYGKKIIPDIM